MDVRKEMPPRSLSRSGFRARFLAQFRDPLFRPFDAQLAEVEEAAWSAYSQSRKSPLTAPAGASCSDPSFELSLDWLKARDDIAAAQARHDRPDLPKNVLIVNGAARTEHTCPGETSKSWRLVKLAEQVLLESKLEVSILDLSRLISEPGLHIHPCKTCVSTAMPLCHWPCSCYPNYALQQSGDWMNEIYPLWVRAHGILIITPVNWYQAPTGLKAMIDRLVCADGGNPDPTSTHGKTVSEAKALELAGWCYPKHLEGRLFALVVHGDATGAETLRRSLSDWLTDMALVSAGNLAEKDGYIGLNEPYATSHQALDSDIAFQQDVRTAALTLARAIRMQAEDRYAMADEGLRPAVEK